MAGLGGGFSAYSPRVGMAQDLSAAGAELPELMTAGRGRTAPACRPGTPRPSPPAGGRWPDITGATCGDEPQTASAGRFCPSHKMGSDG